MSLLLLLRFHPRSGVIRADRRLANSFTACLNIAQIRLCDARHGAFGCRVLEVRGVLSGAIVRRERCFSLWHHPVFFPSVKSDSFVNKPKMCFFNHIHQGTLGDNPHRPG